MPISTQVNKLKINKLTKAQFNTIVPSDTELYFLTDQDDTLPSQEGEEGKFLTTDGTSPSWASVLPAQTGNSGKFLTTDGTDASWDSISSSINVLETSGTINLEDNSINCITPEDNIAFVLPTITDNEEFHQILVQVTLLSIYSIDVGTTYFFNSTEPDLSNVGIYDIIFEYDKENNCWVCGVLEKGAVL